MESTRGRETSGPSVGLWTRKSREKWGPSGQHTPQSSHRPPAQDSTIVGSPGREAVASSTSWITPDSKADARTLLAHSRVERNWPSSTRGAAMTARKNSRARRQLACHPLARHRAHAFQTGTEHARVQRRRMEQNWTHWEQKISLNRRRNAI